jgi:hypothetical protein
VRFRRQPTLYQNTNAGEGMKKITGKLTACGSIPFRTAIFSRMVLLVLRNNLVDRFKISAKL